MLEQTYPGLEDHRKHFDLLLPAFMDERYVKVDGKPLFIIYRPLEIPGLERFVAFWRKLADVSGLPGLYLIGYSKNPAWVPQEHGFDGALIDRMPPVRPWVSRRQPFKWLSRKIQVWRGMPTIYAYEDMLDTLLPSDHTDSDFPCIVPNWDNTPRSGADGLVLHNSTPELFRMQMRAALRWIEDYEPEKRLIFVKSWNEWAEGNHLEPDLRYGRSYLKVIEGEIGCFKSADRERLSA